MSAEKTIRKVYRILEDVTPLKTDCGLLCGGECCKGDDNTGMILFPGEEKFLENSEEFVIKKTTDGKNILICGGRCNRNKRPISCRIFPLFPMIVDGRIYVIDDPRASGICPLIFDEMKLRRSFERKVAKAGKILAENEETGELLRKLTDEISEIISMRQDIFG
ncbi:MAG: hypothetical protein E7555_00675 [Ruminococcaceae bacterium]|nr:hypothetical protein [Oscillospiraceae bacterium]